MSTKSAAAGEYTLKDLLDLHKLEILQSLNCHAVGKIGAFDAAKQTAKVTIEYKRRSGGVDVDYPVLVDCPVVVLAGASGGLTVPVAVGDTCLVLFCDRDIDRWFASGQVAAPETPRLHAFADAVALVGLRHAGNPVASYPANKTKLFFKPASAAETVVELGSKVKVGNATTDLKTVLNGMIDLIKGLQTAGTAAAQTTSPAYQTTLENFKATIGSLLE